MGNPNVGTGMYLIFFSGTASGTGTLRRCRARAPRLTGVIHAIPERKIIIHCNPAKSTHNPVSSENPYLTRMLLE